MVFCNKFAMAVLLTSVKKCGEVKWFNWMKSISCHNKHTMTSIFGLTFNKFNSRIKFLSWLGETCKLL